MLGLRAGSRRVQGWLAAGLAGLSLFAADGPDRMAFDAALRSFSIGAYGRAAEEFAAFSSQFPDSPLKADAARRSLYSRAEADAARGDFAAAQKTFGLYLSQFPGSDLALRASVRRAEALFRSGEPGAAAALLDQADGAFARALAEGRPADLLLAGSMVAAQAHLAAGDGARARASVSA
ncbi:MAG: tetratricopeptide repeat protein, partial [Verrucomicrobiota bacterium]